MDLAVIRWSPRAARQLEDICSFIAKDSPRYAGMFALRIMRMISTIPQTPRLGRVVPEYGDELLRERIYQAYRIVYRVRENAIEIVAICHGARRIENSITESDEA